MPEEFDEAAFRDAAVGEIRAALSFTGWSAARLARQIGVAPSTITRALDPATGYTPSSRTLERLRRTVGQFVDDARGETLARWSSDVATEQAASHVAGAVRIVGTIQDEAWISVTDNEMPTDCLIMQEPRYGDRPLFAFKIVGRGTDKDYDDGAYAIAVPTKHAAFFEDDVVVVRYVKGGLQMTVLMDLVREQGRLALVSRRVEDANQNAERIDKMPEPLEGEVELAKVILGVVIASYRLNPRHFGRPVDIPANFLELTDWTKDRWQTR